jgi:hypothetical protein
MDAVFSKPLLKETAMAILINNPITRYLLGQADKYEMILCSVNSRLFVVTTCKLVLDYKTYAR